MDRLQVHDDDTFFRALDAAAALRALTGRLCVVVQERLPPHVEALFRGSPTSRAFIEQHAGIRVVS